MPLDNRFIHGADRLQQRIRTIRTNLGIPAMVDEIGDLLLRRTLDRFDQEVDPDGNPWPPLKEVTLQRRQRSGGGEGTKMLSRSGALRNAIKLIRGSVLGTTFTNTGAGVRIGVEDPDIATYGRVQNQGYGPHNIPARRFLGIGRLDVKAVDSLLRRKAQDIEDTA